VRRIATEIALTSGHLGPRRPPGHRNRFELSIPIPAAALRRAVL